MSVEPNTTRQPHPRWGLILLSLCLVAAPVIAHSYWNHSLIWFGMLAFYLSVGLYLKSPVIVCTMLGVLFSPFLGASHYSSEEELWDSLIPSGCIGFGAGLALELLWANITPNGRHDKTPPPILRS